jgi:hypothetical protein
MNAQERLLRWHFSWRIKNNVVSCRSCHASQIEADMSRPFEHLTGCLYSAERFNPWHELDRISLAAPSSKNLAKPSHD